MSRVNRRISFGLYSIVDPKMARSHCVRVRWKRLSQPVRGRTRIPRGEVLRLLMVVWDMVWIRRVSLVIVESVKEKLKRVRGDDSRR